MNPRGGAILGLPAYPSPDDLPTTPELVIDALGGAAATPVIEECARHGVPAAIVIAAGFAEAGEQGAALQQELARAADEGGVTLVGPNCMGVLCTSAALNAVGFVTLRPEPGPVSVISQSGNIGTQLLMTAERRGVGVEKFVSSGNQATTDANDLLEYMADDPKTGVVVMYLEGVGDGRRFYELARATAPRKPVIVMRGGLSALGRGAASSHTGALAGSAEVFRAATRQAGVITTSDPDEALDVASLLAYQPLPGGSRVAVVTLGGGWGVLTADALAENGLQLAELPPPVLAAVGELLPPFWSRGDPIDLVATVTDGVPERIIELVAESETVDAVMTLALIGSPSSGRAGQTRRTAGGSSGTATTRHRRPDTRSPESSRSSTPASARSFSTSPPSPNALASRSSTCRCARSSAPCFRDSAGTLPFCCPVRRRPCVPWPGRPGTRPTPCALARYRPPWTPPDRPRNRRSDSLRRVARATPPNRPSLWARRRRALSPCAARRGR